MFAWHVPSSYDVVPTSVHQMCRVGKSLCVADIPSQIDSVKLACEIRYERT